MQNLAAFQRNRFGVSWLVPLVMLGACSSSDNGTTDPPDGPTTGMISVSATTTGDDQDTNGYSVMLDGTDRAAIGVNGSVNLSGVSPGSRSVSFSGVAENCTVGGEHPRSVSVTAGATAQVAFQVSCVATVGSIEVTVSTTGDGTDPDGYLVSVDGGNTELVAANGSVTLTDVPAGARLVELMGVAVNCEVQGGNPVAASVLFGGTASVSFDVACVLPPPGKIAFYSERTSKLEIYTMNGAGSDVRQVTDSPEIKIDLLLLLSPDGSKILFLTETSAGADLWVVNTDGTGLLRLTDGMTSRFISATWSPDGLRVAYSRREGDCSQVAAACGISVINADGTGKQDLTDFGGLPDWSPNGSTIAFDDDDGLEIWTVGSDGSGLAQLTAGQFMHPFGPRWSPDGTRIMLEADSQGFDQLAVIQADGTGAQLLTNLNSDTGSGAWSPDGSTIAFRAGTGCGDDRGIYLMAADGTGVTQLTHGCHSGTAWSPDGSTVAFNSMGNAEILSTKEIFSVDLASGRTSNLTNNQMEDGLGSWGP